MNLKMLAKRKLVLQSSLAFISLCLLQLTTWIPLRYWGAWGGGNFLDTWQILRYGKCYETVGLSVYENSGTNCSNYLYGRTLLQLLSFLKIDVSQTQFLGYVFLLLLAVGLSMVFPIKSQKDCLTFVLVLVSPPIMLLADRGNFDILIFFILILVAKSMIRGNIYFAYGLLSFTVLLKYYTAPIFLLLIFYSKSTRDRIFGILLLFTTAWFSFRDIAITEANYPHGSDAQFGFSVWGEYLNQYSSTQVNEIQKYAISAAIFSCILLVVLFTTKRFRLQEIEIDEACNWQTFAFWIFLVVSITCYFGGMNFDYRLVFYASTILLAIKVFPNLLPRPMVNSLMIVLWFSFPSGGLQPLGDLVIEVTVSYLLIFAGTQALRKTTSLKTKNELI